MGGVNQTFMLQLCPPSSGRRTPAAALMRAWNTPFHLRLLPSSSHPPVNSPISLCCLQGNFRAAGWLFVACQAGGCNNVSTQLRIHFLWTRRETNQERRSPRIQTAEGEKQARKLCLCVTQIKRLTHVATWKLAIGVGGGMAIINRFHLSPSRAAGAKAVPFFMEEMFFALLRSSSCQTVITTYYAPWFES